MLSLIVISSAVELTIRLTLSEIKYKYKKQEVRIAQEESRGRRAEQGEEGRLKQIKVEQTCMRRTEHSKTERSRLEQSRAVQYREKQRNEEQNGAEQNRTEKNIEQSTAEQSGGRKEQSESEERRGIKSEKLEVFDRK